MEKTSVGMDENIEGALCYVLGWLTGVVFYLIEKDNKFVRFHAKQSILVFLPLNILSMIFGGWFFFSWHLWMFWWLFSLISWLIWLLTFILWIVLMYKAYKGEKYKVPIVGDMAEKNL